MMYVSSPHRAVYVHRAMGVFQGVCAECPSATYVEYVVLSINDNKNTCIVTGH